MYVCWSSRKLYSRQIIEAKLDSAIARTQTVLNTYSYLSEYCMYFPLSVSYVPRVCLSVKSKATQEHTRYSTIQHRVSYSIHLNTLNTLVSKIQLLGRRVGRLPTPRNSTSNLTMSGIDNDDTTDPPSLPPVLNATDHIDIANDVDDPTNQSCDPPVLNSTSNLTMSGNDNNDEPTDSTERALTKEFNLCDIRAVKASKTYIKFQNAVIREEIKYNGQNFVKGKEGAEKRLLRTLINKQLSRNKTKKNYRTVRSEAATEESVRSTPTFIKWMSLEDGRLLPVGKGRKAFQKGGKDEEERLIQYLVMNNRKSYEQQIMKRAKINGEEGKPVTEGMDLTRRREEVMVVAEEEVALRTEEEEAARSREEETAAWEGDVRETPDK